MSKRHLVLTIKYSGRKNTETGNKHVNFVLKTSKRGSFEDDQSCLENFKKSFLFPFECHYKKN